MSIEQKIRQEVLKYLKSLDTPDNEVYQKHGFLIDSCFVKALEIVERVVDESTVHVYPLTPGECDNKTYNTQENGDK